MCTRTVDIVCSIVDTEPKVCIPGSSDVRHHINMFTFFYVNTDFNMNSAYCSGFNWDYFVLFVADYLLKLIQRLQISKDQIFCSVSTQFSWFEYRMQQATECKQISVKLNKYKMHSDADQPGCSKHDDTSTGCNYSIMSEETQKDEHTFGCG